MSSDFASIGYCKARDADRLLPNEDVFDIYDVSQDLVTRREHFTDPGATPAFDLLENGKRYKEFVTDKNQNTVMSVFHRFVHPEAKVTRDEDGEKVARFYSLSRKSSENT